MQISKWQAAAWVTGPVPVPSPSLGVSEEQSLSLLQRHSEYQCEAQMRDLRPKEVNTFAQGHIAS